MTLTLYYHPFSRAAGVVWMLEELGQPYDLKFIDLQAGEQRAPEFLRINPMGKLPALVDSGTIVTESAAIALYLADRYSPGRLAPALDDPARATYLRWICFAPAVIEPSMYARGAQWAYRAAQAGWGQYDDVLDSIERAIGEGPWLLGDRFTMADVVFGGTLRFMLMFKMIDARPSYVAYVERLDQRPAYQAARARNEAVVVERGLQR